MLEGTPITEPISYGYLLLAASLVLLASLAGIAWIIRETRKTATSEADYLAYWETKKEIERAEKKPFDYAAYLDRALMGTASAEEHQTARRLCASSWQSSPSGHPRYRLKRDKNGMPEDAQLRYLEYQFTACLTGYPPNLQQARMLLADLLWRAEVLSLYTDMKQQLAR